MTSPAGLPLHGHRTNRLARLSVSTKLVIGYFAFVLPVAVLVLFVESGFSRDLRSVDQELGGVAYAERVLNTHYAVTKLAVARAFTAPETADLERDALDATRALSVFHVENAGVLGLTEQRLASHGLTGLSAGSLIDRLDQEISAGGSISAELVQSLLLLSETALNLTGGTQDPALDSNALIRAILVQLPVAQRTAGDALLVTAISGDDPGKPRSESESMALQTLGGELRIDAAGRVGTLVSLSIRADGEFYRDHSALHVRLEDALTTFLSASGEFAGYLTSSPDRAVADARATVSAGLRVLTASGQLYAVGTEAVRTLVEDRARALKAMRTVALASSFSALLLVALLVYWISRSVRTSVAGIAAYTRKVAQGDYAAALHVQLPDDLYEIYLHTKSMISDITTLAEFPRQNPNGVLAVRSDGEVIYHNPSAQRFMDERGLTIDELLPPNHSEIIERLMTNDRHSQQTETTGKDFVLEWAYHPAKENELVHVYFTDVTERKRAEDQLIHDSFHDSLTGLPNRALFTDRLSQTISATDPASPYTFAVFLLDLDRFKVINDSLGHDYGDALLRIVAGRVAEVTRPQDTVARLGGDEFAVLLPNLEDSREALHIAERIHEAVRNPITIRGEKLTISCSIGIVFPGSDRRDPESLRLDPRLVEISPQAILRDADSAMYSAKSNGKARSEIFNSSMYESALRTMQLESELLRAVNEDEIIPYYQPIVSLRNGRIAGFEALARWDHPSRGILSPGTFIPLAEETGLIVPIGESILKTAAAQICEWSKTFPDSGDLVASVNLSVRQFAHPGLMDDIRSVLAGVGMKSQCLKLEITESGLMEDVETSLALLTRLKKLEITLSIDDFGTGYSSLAYLHKFPFDTLKVDQSFVGSMEGECESREIVTNILSLARGLGKETIAEGIETEAQLGALRELGADYGQGYFFAHPLPAAEAADLLRTDPRW